MTILEKLAALRPAPLPKGREFERPPAWEGVAPVAAPTLIRCPRCDNHVALEPQTCERCGFPFICDTAPVDSARVQRRTTTWRTVLAIGVLIFWLTNVAFVAAGSEAYQGLTSGVVANLTADTSSGIPISGPESFVKRTQLALGLLKSRAPQFYYRMQQGVTRIDFLSSDLIDEQSGQRISLEGIGAVSTPSTGRVQVLVTTAFPSGLGELNDGDVFTYAGVLVHELRHIELHNSGSAPGGWEEEVLCEEAAYAAVKAMDAPGMILTRYELYLRNPHAKEFQSWYDWYNQFE
jgi:hypothetical protein